MKVKTSELSGPTLRWAVGVALGYEMSVYGVETSIRARVPGLGVHAPWEPDRQWSQGEPIIERENIWLKKDNKGVPLAFIPGDRSDTYVAFQAGPNPLTAAMRCFVSMRMGDEVEVPDGMSKA